MCLARGCLQLLCKCWHTAAKTLSQVSYESETENLCTNAGNLNIVPGFRSTPKAATAMLALTIYTGNSSQTAGVANPAY